MNSVQPKIEKTEIKREDIAEHPSDNWTSMEKVIIENTKYLFKFFSSPGFCNYDSFEVANEFRVVMRYDNRCGRPVDFEGDYVIFRHSYTAVLRLGPQTNDIYVAILEEPENTVFKTTFFRARKDLLQEAATFDFVPEIGDKNGDGLLDVLKKGGRNSEAKSYEPYLVYVQTKTDDKVEFLMDEKLSEKYSLENKFQWHGSKSRTFKVDEKGKIQK